MNDSVLRTATAALEFTKANVTSSTPWNGIGDLPRKVDGGYPYIGVNIPALLGQISDSNSPAIFGSCAQWGNAGKKVKKGSKGLGFIYMKSFKKQDKTVSNLKQQDEDLVVSENGRVLVPYASFAAFAQCQMEDYDAGAHHPVLEALKRLQMDDAALIECGMNAKDSAERYMDAWMLSANANVRKMSEGERCFIVHLAADLVVGFNAGSMALAGELNGCYPTLAITAVESLTGTHIMRPWGIACDILRQLSPVFDANVMAGIEAAKVKQDAFKKKFVKPGSAKSLIPAGEDIDSDVIGEDAPVPAAEIVPVPASTASVLEVILKAANTAPDPVATKAIPVPVLEESELVEFDSNW